MAPQYSSDCVSSGPSIGAVRGICCASVSLTASSFLLKLQVFSQTSFISSRHSISRKAEKATFSKEGLKDVSICIGLISRGTVSSLPGKLCGGGTQYNLDNGSTLECFLPGRCIIVRFGAYAENTVPHAANLRFAFS